MIKLKAILMLVVGCVLFFVSIRSIQDIGVHATNAQGTATYKEVMDEVKHRCSLYAVGDEYIDTLDLINIDYLTTNIKEASEAVINVATKLVYLPDKVYHALVDKEIIIYITNDFLRSYKDIINDSATEEDIKSIAGVATIDKEKRTPAIIVRADQINHVMYHEIGHIYDLISGGL